MAIKHSKPFERRRLDEEREKDKHFIISIRYNENERQAIEEAGRILEEEKFGSTFKQLAKLGLHVLHESLEGRVVRQVFKNRKDNRRLGILIDDK